ncbi:hypothetical protein M501DRAFT_1004297 [Patellaria atrata CBS 101060]|uniref:Uncharacterized protein n=1 Tax=Patellaria atrata CBS 101060 TaxID=1346257 RepID=A0A9P4VSH0_9PEZI|nr:hypothetical protein M501DRAFT_1004297 [Patellaria atrata CBS 101060]
MTVQAPTDDLSINLLAMSLTVKALNGDTTFLLTFTPPVAPVSSPGLFPGSFTILIDPWLMGKAKIFSTKFSVSEQKITPSVSSLADLPEPDLILISQDKPDHCHEETLRTLPSNARTIIVATSAAARKIKSWGHFKSSSIQVLQKYDEKKDESVFTLILPPFSPRGSPGEVTVCLLPAKRDVTGLHNAVGITYRAPCSVLSAAPGSYIDLPPTPPASPLSPRTISATPRTIVPSPFYNREKTMSVIYSPHGVSYNIIKPYASSYLVNESALPLTALIHSFDRVENPWYLGGNVAAGTPGGIEIAKSLLAKSWISAHDADKDNRGLSIKRINIKKYKADHIKAMLTAENGQSGSSDRGPKTEVIDLAVGGEFRITV